jgi:hypothetical protein
MNTYGLPVIAQMGSTPQATHSGINANGLCSFIQQLNIDQDMPTAVPDTVKSVCLLNSPCEN